MLFLLFSVLLILLIIIGAVATFLLLWGMNSFLGGV